MTKRIGFVASTIGAVAAVVVAVHAAQTPAPAGAPSLTAADYIEIQQLAVRYSYAMDSGADGGEMLASLFAPDGTFESATRGRIAGHDQLVALGKARDPMYPRRFIVNHVIEPAAGGAIGRAYVVEVDLPSQGEKLGGELSPTGGRYEDVYEKTAAGWRFKSRRFVPAKMAVPGAAARAAAAAAPTPAPAPAAR